MYIFFFFIIVLAYFSPMLISDQIFIGRDLGIYFLPPRLLWVDLVKHLELPLWNPYSFSGIPLLATLHPGIFYPPHLLYLLFPFNLVWNWLIILHFSFAGITMFLLARYLKASQEGAFVAGITFMLSGFLFSNHNLPTFLFAIGWTPLILCCALRYMDRANPKVLVATAVLMAVQFFAGAPEITLMTVLAVVSVVLFPAGFASGPRGVRFKVRTILLTVLLFVLLSAVQILPFYELYLHNARRLGLSFQEVTVWSMAWRDFLQVLLMDPFGYRLHENSYWAGQSLYATLYLGVLPLFLSACFFSARDRRKILFLAVMALSILLCLGRNTPLYSILYHIPPFMSLRFPVKFIFPIFFILSLTAGLGFDNMRRGVAQGERGVKTAVRLFLWIGLAAALLLMSILFIREETYRNLHYVKRLLLFTVFFSAALLLYLRTSLKKVFSIVLVALLVLDLFLIHYGLYSRAPWKPFIDRGRLEEYSFLQGRGERVKYFVTRETFRLFYTELPKRLQFLFHYPSIFGIYSIDGSEVLNVENYVRFLNMLYSPASTEQAGRLLDVSGIRYIVSASPMGGGSFREGELSLTKRTEVAGVPLYIYDYKGSPGRFSFFSRARHVRDEEEMMSGLLFGGFDSRKEVLLQSADLRTEVLDGRDGKAEPLSQSANRVVVRTITDGNSFLYAADTWYPGWHAYVDGTETKIYKANLTFRAIKVPPGEHIITFQYRPTLFLLGLILTILGIILSVLLIRRNVEEALRPGPDGGAPEARFT